MSLSDLNTLYAAAVAALDAADYATAIRKAMAIQARLATTPNVTRDLAGGGSQGLSFNPSQLDSFIANCRKLATAASFSTAIPVSKITYERAETTDDYS